jgi:hypothetical protein
VHPSLAIAFERAAELLVELDDEYQSCLDAKTVSMRAQQLTHEVIERLRSVLDRAARRYWSVHVADQLSEEDRAKAIIYFPIAASEHELQSTLGRWRWKGARDNHLELIAYLDGRQPYRSANNNWLAILNDLAAQGKHVDLVPQKRSEERCVTVEHSSGMKVSWNQSAVKFGPGVSLAGAAIDPKTQQMKSTEHATVRHEVWVSFVIDGHNVNASSFCRKAIQNTKSIVEEMTDLFAI